jgi:hypothetical protein
MSPTIGKNGRAGRASLVRRPVLVGRFESGNGACKSTSHMGEPNTMNRIYSKRLYVVAIPQGLSGFPQPPVCGIVTGASKRRHGYRDWIGAHNVNTATYRVETGRFPEYQPTVGIEVVSAYLADYPSGCAVAVA